MAFTRRIHEAIDECLADIQSNSSPEAQLKALQTLVNITKVSPQNRNFLAQTNDAVISNLFSLSKSSPLVPIQCLSLSILFNLSLNPNLKQSLADMENIIFLNSASLSSSCEESSKLAASLLCSLAMSDKNKAKFGVAGTIQALVTSMSDTSFHSPAFHHLLSSLVELVQFHGNCTLAVRSGAVPMLIKVVESEDIEDHGGTSLAILNLIARFGEGLVALANRDQIVGLMLQVLKRRCMFSKENAAEILLKLFDESEECLRDGLRLNEFSSVLADISIRGSARAREKATLLLRKIMETNLEAYTDGNSIV